MTYLYKLFLVIYTLLHLSLVTRSSRGKMDKMSWRWTFRKVIFLGLVAWIWMGVHDNFFANEHWTSEFTGDGAKVIVPYMVILGCWSWYYLRTLSLIICRYPVTCHVPNWGIAMAEGLGGLMKKWLHDTTDSDETRCVKLPKKSQVNGQTTF